jgi:hypothetical protein
MTALAIAATVLMLVLATKKEPTDEARTPQELWAAAKTHGWKRLTLLTAHRGLVLVLLVAGCVAILALDATLKVGQGALLVAAVVCWHVRDLVGYGPVAVREES